MKRFAVVLTIVVIAAAAWLVISRLKTAREFKSQEVVVYAYTSFVSSWGPGPAIATEFETLYGAKVRLIDAGDSRLLPQKLAAEGDKLAADVVLGFDQYSLEEAKNLKWREIKLDSSIKWNSDFPKSSLQNNLFVPFDWAPLTFIYRKGEIEPPKSLADLKKPEYEKMFSVIDPRTSTPGYQFLEWIVSLYGIEGAKTFLSEIDKSIFTVSTGWSSAYGLFTKKHAKLVFSYVTSAAYHWNEDKDQSYQPVVLAEPHPYQVEFAAVPQACKSCDAAEEFVKFLLSKSSQTRIMNSNYMFPVIAGVVEGTDFEQLPKLKLQEPQPQTKETVAQNLAVWKAQTK